MIAKIMKPASGFDAVYYNENKVKEQKAELLTATNFHKTGTNLTYLSRSEYIAYFNKISNLNSRVKNRQFHAVLSTKGQAHTAQELKAIGEAYIKQMGYAENPYLIYFHQDTEHNHIHIVSTRVDKNGEKVDDSFEKKRSLATIERIMQQSNKADWTPKNLIDDILAYNFTTEGQLKTLLELRGYTTKEGDTREMQIWKDNLFVASIALILMRLVRLINSRGNLPCSLIIDEAPTLYFHKLENLLATARSNQVATLLGLQELPQLKQQYGKETAETICAICGNVISGSVRNKDTLEWLEKLFGKVKQVKESMSINRNQTTFSQNENMDFLIPSAKIANLRTGEVVAKVALEANINAQNAYHCQIDLDINTLQKEEKQYPQMPVFYDFKGQKEEALKSNYVKINKDIIGIVQAFLNTPSV